MSGILVINDLHHVAVICSDYQTSKDFYCRVLGCQLIAERYRIESNSWKADLGLNNRYLIELFWFPGSPERQTLPEACGLRHLAFAVDNIERAVEQLKQHNIYCEAIRIDPYSGKKYTFFPDPDQLPLELYES